MISRGFRESYPHIDGETLALASDERPISLRCMEQIFPSPVDDVDVASLIAAEERASHPTRPWVMSNMISSIDGAIAIDGVSGGLGGPGDKAVFSALRAIADIIVVASGTAVAENYRRPQTSPETQERRVARGQTPLPQIAIVSGSLTIDPAHRVFDPDARPLIITHDQSPPDRREALGQHADIITAGADEVDLSNALTQLHDSGARSVLLEGGPTLNGAFAASDLIDEWALSSAPVIVGGTEGRAVTSTSSFEPRRFSLARTLHDDGFLFHRYLRDR